MPLSSVSWADVEILNRHLCLAGNYQAGRTSDGYEAARSHWETYVSEAGEIEAIAQLCRECHRLAPFLFLNGNTFTALARQALMEIFETTSLRQAVILRNVVGHYVAGTIDLWEFRKIVKANHF